MTQGKLIKLTLCAGVIGGLLLLGWQRWAYAKAYVSTDNAELDGVIIPVRAKLSGVVTQVPVADNMPVATGDLLFQVRDSEYRQQLAQRQAHWQALRVTAGQDGSPGQLDSQILGAMARRQAAEAALAQSHATLEQARNDYQRARRLHAQGATSTQDLETIKARFDALNHAQEVARGNSRAAAQNTLANQAELKAQDYRITAARAELELARIRLEDTRQTAPLPSIVSKKEVEPGQYVVAGQKLMSLIGIEPLWITANFKETQVGRVRIGQKARITVDAFPDTTFAGTVQSLAPATGARFSLLPQENATGNFTKVVQRVQVRIALDDVPTSYSRLLSPGMSAFVEVEAHEPDGAVP
ncbi:HlyD family secretion protein [Pseudomonas entomophila]|uniref:HlyD family secretion protein n=1 Tax=Pseudomonas entomophila TaxID=312306 RepID=UPI0015E38743|nr:HlyD family secretion protein [Pseudomonas entomophila]MBA1188384.1 HlyD family secretion protein [Pseudomonas entomophila]